MRVLVADDHALVRAGFCLLLSSLGFDVVGEAGDGPTVLRLLPECRPDVVLMPVSSPGFNGLDITARIRAQWPGTRVLILSMHRRAEYAHRALTAGASGYILKDADAAELETALNLVARGDIYLSPSVAGPVVPVAPADSEDDTARLDRLSPRQRQVLQMMAEGCARRMIAEQLSISAKTVDTYRRQILDNLGIRDNARLVRFAIRTGLASEP